MAVLERSELDASPLADLHAIADQIGLDGFRRLRKADLIDAILERSGVAGEAVAGRRRGSAGDERSERRRLAGEELALRAGGASPARQGAGTQERGREAPGEARGGAGAGDAGDPAPRRARPPRRPRGGCREESRERGTARSRRACSRAELRARHTDEPAAAATAESGGVREGAVSAPASVAGAGSARGPRRPRRAGNGAPLRA